MYVYIYMYIYIYIYMYMYMYMYMSVCFEKSEECNFRCSKAQLLSPCLFRLPRRKRVLTYGGFGTV